MERKELKRFDWFIFLRIMHYARLYASALNLLILEESRQPMAPRKIQIAIIFQFCFHMIFFYDVLSFFILVKKNSIIHIRWLNFYLIVDLERT